MKPGFSRLAPLLFSFLNIEKGELRNGVIVYSIATVITGESGQYNIRTDEVFYLYLFN